MRLVFASLVAGLLLASTASAEPILIINGTSMTSEPGTTNSITTNLSLAHTQAGNTVTVSDGVPLNLSAYSQVWDLRFSNASALSIAERAQYLAYLQAGGGMFVMGENSGFMTRNNSVLALIAAAGGGALTFVSPNDSQTVLAPFNGPNIVNSFNYAASGGVTSDGTGDFMTVDGLGRGTGLAFSVGDLANAPLGALTVVFDVNFMQWNVDPPSDERFTRNLISFIEDQTTSEVPEPASMAVWASICGIGLLMRRRRGAA